MGSESILRAPALWVGVALSGAVAVGVGLHRTPKGPPWWNAGLVAGALALVFGVTTATLCLFRGEPGRSLWSRLNVRLFLSSVTMLFLGLGCVMVAQDRSGVVETVKGMCFMYGGVVLASAVLSALMRFLTDRIDVGVRWAIFGMSAFFGLAVVALALGAGEDEVAWGATNRFAGAVLIVKGLLGLTAKSTPVNTGCAWLGVAGVVACCVFLARPDKE